MLKRSLVMLVSLTCLVVGGCSDDNPVAEKLAEETSPLDDLVIANCYAVQAAAEAYADEHYGQYPDRPPAIRSMENPYTNLLTEPRSEVALYPGQTGYLAYCGDSGARPGYLITGYGVKGELIALSNLPRGVFYFMEQTIANCLTVQHAVEAFAAENDGNYPDDVDVGRSLAGKTVNDYLPGGSRLRNPYTGARTEPVDGAAATAGQTGYAAIRMDRNVGYTITGWGKCTNLVTLERGGSYEDGSVIYIAHKVRGAVEEFADDNDGVYPSDVDTDVTLSGKTVLDLMDDNSRRWHNSYTLERTEPRNGLVAERGQVGYVPVSRRGENKGYTINGWGLFGEVIRLEE